MDDAVPTYYLLRPFVQVEHISKPSLFILNTITHLIVREAKREQITIKYLLLLAIAHSL